MAAYRVPGPEELPALPGFVGGLVGYFGYDCVRHIEPRLCHAPVADPVGMPDLWLTLSQTVVVFDNLRDTVFLVVLADAAAGFDLRARTAEIRARLLLVQCSTDAIFPPDADARSRLHRIALEWLGLAPRNAG